MPSFTLDTSARDQLVDITNEVARVARELEGRWQRVFFCEFDGPRQGRTVLVTGLAGSAK